MILGITIPAVFLVTLLVTVVVLILSAAPERAPVATTAYVSAGGTAYVCYEDGKFLEVGKEISNATLSPDRQHLVVQDRKGKFYLTDVELSEKTELIRFDPKKETLMYECSNVGVFFSVMNSESGEVGYYSYYFDLEGEEVIEIVSGKRSEFDDVTVGFDPYGDSYAMAYAQEGDIFLFDAYSDHATKVSSYRENETINLIGVSSDASLLAWTQTDITGTAKLHLCEYGEVSIRSCRGSY